MFYYPHHAKKKKRSENKKNEESASLSEVTWFWTLSNFILWSVGSFTSIIVLRIRDYCK